MSRHSADGHFLGRWAMAVWLGGLLAAPVPVPALDEPPKGIDQSVFKGFHQLTALMDRPDWDNEHAVIERSIDNLWRRNRWTDEPDRFARDLVCEIAAVPPWEPMKRLNLFSDRVAERYGVSGEQAVRLKAVFMRETGRFLMRNGPLMLKQARDYMKTRAAGEPFTAERVAEWSREGQPLLADLQEIVERVSKELEPMLEPAGRRFLRQDLKSLEKRRRYVDKMYPRWAQGKWQPADWGLQNNPMYDRNLSVEQTSPTRLAAQPLNPSRRDRPTKIPPCVSHDASTWFACVLELQKRYKLDSGQKNTSESIHAELYTRAQAYIEVHAETLDQVPQSERASHEAYEPIRTLFHELLSRLDAIPTSSQRERAKE